MSGFSQFYIEFLNDLWANICRHFQMLWTIISDMFYTDWAVNGYFNSFVNAIGGGWNALDFIAFIIVLIINVPAPSEEWAAACFCP